MQPIFDLFFFIPTFTICTNRSACPCVAGLYGAINFGVITFVSKNVNNSCENKSWMCPLFSIFSLRCLILYYTESMCILCPLMWTLFLS